MDLQNQIYSLRIPCPNQSCGSWQVRKKGSKCPGLSGCQLCKRYDHHPLMQSWEIAATVNVSHNEKLIFFFHQVNLTWGQVILQVLALALAIYATSSRLGNFGQFCWIPSTISRCIIHSYITYNCQKRLVIYYQTDIKSTHFAGEELKSSQWQSTE